MSFHIFYGAFRDEFTLRNDRNQYQNQVQNAIEPKYNE